MQIVEMNTKPASEAQEDQDQGVLRPSRRIARQMLERGQRLRNRAGVFIGLSLGLVALLSVID